MTLWKNLVVALVAAFALAACSSSDNGTDTSMPTDPPPTQAEQDLEALQDQIAALRKQLGIDDDDNADIGTTITELQATLRDLQKQVDDAAADADAAAKKAAAADAEALFAGLDADRVANGAADLALTIAAGGVTQTYGEAAKVTAEVTPDGGTGTTPEVEATDTAVDSQGVWKGTELFAGTAGAAGRLPSHTVVVYTDVMEDKMVAFAEVYTTATEDGLDLSTGAATYAEVIESADFDHTGRKVHGDADTNGEDLEFRGTFDDAPGKYTCGEGAGENDCTSNKTNAGIVLAGNWLFVPDVNAMVSQPDGGYAYFGWWLYRDSVGPEADGFHGMTGHTAIDTTSFGALGGTATYKGAAAGQYAIDPVAPGTYATSGRFTANVTLNANFEDPDNADPVTQPGSISGKLDGFMSDGEMMPWSVSLGETNFAAANDGMFASAGDRATTPGDDVVWTIDNESAPESGQWMGALHDQGDNNVPNVATGKWDATYSEGGHTIGHMVGAFGASIE